MDLPKTRKAAAAINAKKYFTGEPCSKNHVAPRYTQSGTCQECIAQNAKKNGTIPAQFRTMNATRAAVMSQLTEIKLRLFPNDVRSLSRLAGNLLVLRYPEMKETDAVPNKAPTHAAGGTLLYKMRCHPDDVEFLINTAVTMTNQAAQANMVEIKQRVASRAASMVPVEYEPAFRP